MCSWKPDKLLHVWTPPTLRAWPLTWPFFPTYFSSLSESERERERVSSEEQKKNGMEGEKREVLHQRRSLPFSTMQMAVAAIGYFTLYTKAKPEASAAAVAKATTGASGDDRKRQSK